MNYRAKIGISILIILAVLGISLSREYSFDTTGEIIVMLSAMLIPVLLVLLLLKQGVFTTWFKFARIYIPLFVLFIMFGGNGGGNSLGIESGEFYGSLLGFVYFLISIVLIIRAHRRLKRQAKAGSLAS